MASILATSRSFGAGDRDLVAELEAAGHRVVRGASDHPVEGLRDALGEADAWIAGTGPVTAAHLDAAPRLRVIARYGVGVEAVDVAAATARGIVVANTPGANADAVADHAVALMLAALRSVAAGDRRVRAGDWSALRGRQLGALAVGIVGFGRIGRGVAARLQGFGPRILAADPLLDAPDVRSAGAEPVEFRAMAERCDLVSLHAPGGQVLVDAAWLDRLERPIVLVNTARADLVDEAALAAAIRDGRVAAFAADTLSGDTAASASPLLADDLADRVTVTPHLGAQTVEAVDAMGSMAVANALAVLEGRSAPHAVNRIDSPAEGHGKEPQ
ncbi:NAD(P)-dependent oxidoreductase [Agrococcus lahaulensis]|uniref:NAD(P)-dependent oxidoreductase n=1 Tax=Agrococcus lahaulensis TaxID=341722 RepID=UPI000687EFC9|nr:NAD(P)-dependent oxidoreductase [Agrococcus lahaulensis]